MTSAQGNLKLDILRKAFFGDFTKALIKKTAQIMIMFQNVSVGQDQFTETLVKVSEKCIKKKLDRNTEFYPILHPQCND